MSAATREGSTRSVTSTYVRPREKPKPQTELHGVKGTPRQAFYLGNIHPGCAAETIDHYCREQDVTVLSCRVSTSKVYGTAFAHLVVYKEQGSTILKKKFWPDEIYARLWVHNDNLGSNVTATDDARNEREKAASDEAAEPGATSSDSEAAGCDDFRKGGLD